MTNTESFVRDGKWTVLKWTDEDGRNHDHRIGSLCGPCMDDYDEEAENN